MSKASKELLPRCKALVTRLPEVQSVESFPLAKLQSTGPGFICMHTQHSVYTRCACVYTLHSVYAQAHLVAPHPFSCVQRVAGVTCHSRGDLPYSLSTSLVEQELFLSWAVRYQH
jgi:hypothetical protein